MSRAIVCGGGIGGLASAVALIRRGWHVEVLERSPAFEEVGAGLSLWPNALRALEAIGLGGAVRERSALAGPAGIRDSRGRWLSQVQPDAADPAVQIAMIHRADLLDVLRTAVPGDALRAGTVVHAVDPGGVVVHSHGRSEADLIVGADGIRSTVRASVWPAGAAARYVGYRTWRTVTAPFPIDQGGESWGRGERFGYAALPDGRVYWFAVANGPEGEEGIGLDHLRQRFGAWHDPIPALLDAARDDRILYHDLYELPRLSRYVMERVALVGDAAHAMTPDLGQGACQALEDAVVLAASMDDEGGLDGYDRRRRPRTQRIAARARRTGAVAQWSAAPAVALRNGVVRHAPPSALSRSLASIVDWTAPR